MEPSSSTTSFEISCYFCLQASRKKVREFQNWLMIRLVPSFKLKTKYLQETCVSKHYLFQVRLTNEYKALSRYMPTRDFSLIIFGLFGLFWPFLASFPSQHVAFFVCWDHHEPFSCVYPMYFHLNILYHKQHRKICGQNDRVCDAYFSAQQF